MSTIRGLATRTPSPRFTAASAAVSALSAPPSNEDKLRLYALFKQATAGPASGAPAPSMFDVVGKYKHNAWSALGDMSAEEAERQYCALVESLGGARAASTTGKEDGGAGPAAISGGSYTTLLISDVGGVRTVTLNRPDKRNALSVTMYNEVIAALRAAATDASVRVVVLTGAGSYYCAVSSSAP